MQLSSILIAIISYLNMRRPFDLKCPFEQLTAIIQLAATIH